MKLSLLSRVFGICFVALFPLSGATPISERPSGKVIRLPVAQRNSPSTLKRDVNVPLTNAVSSYQVSLDVGTPSQQVTLSLDTGSSDIWVYGQGSCSSCRGGTFDTSTSSTVVSESDIGPLNVQYFDQTYVQGIYVSDDIAIGGTAVSSAIIGVATASSDSGYGLLGIGLDALESVASPYPGLIDDLKSQGLINVRAYSLYLDDLASSSGSLLLGGVDPSKYTGDLVTLPIVASSDGAARLSIEWSSISITGSGGDTTQYYPSYLPYPAVLDTGYTLSVLGDDLFQDFVSYFGASQDSSGAWKVDCALSGGYVNLGFGNDAVVISVPFSELAVPNIIDDSGGCIFGFEPAGSNTNVVSFGDTVLRSMYVLYNYDAMTISVAEASFDQSCTECAVEI